MASTQPNPGARVIALNGNRLGQIAGAIVACIVMAFSFYVHNVDTLTAFTRTGWAFVISYGATYFLVRVVLVTTLRQLLEERRKNMQERRAKHREQRSEASTDAAETPPVPEPESQE